MKDLVILVADKNAQFALRGAFQRPQALGTRPFDYEFRVHIGRDGGDRSSGVDLRGFSINADGKPDRPKEELDALVPVHRQPRSSALYEKVTARISLRRCNDPAFSRLRATLEAWFPASQTVGGIRSQP
jgi:hypothetical protein